MKKKIADLLFVLQIACTWVFGGSQFIRMLTSIQGVSTSMFLLTQIFLLINCGLAIQAHRAKPSRVTKQTLFSYFNWTVMYTADLGLIVYKGAGWDKKDSMTTLVVVCGVALTLIWALFRSKMTDPMVRGVSALFFKSVPQFALAYKIALVGGAGLAGLAIIAGHITILTRLGQLWFAIREAGWDRARIASAVSEVANEVSWLAATLAWLIV